MHEAFRSFAVVGEGEAAAAIFDEALHVDFLQRARIKLKLLLRLSTPRPRNPSPQVPSRIRRVQ
ncbi:hypothetical protein [Corynebacterium mustelae]|uniref:hypothetical protein n=1 Tax=Corynebacterium mustelae TaxID=571915 RepID=UPI000B044EA5|nr:hypothetical protein [Corynebacterium mustelae]